MAKNKLNAASPMTPAAKSTAIAMPKSDRDYEARERKYKAEDGLRSLERAEEVKRDKTLMRDVKVLARQKVKNLKKI